MTTTLVGSEVIVRSYDGYAHQGRIIDFTNRTLVPMYRVELTHDGSTVSLWLRRKDFDA